MPYWARPSSEPSLSLRDRTTLISKNRRSTISSCSEKTAGAFDKIVLTVRSGAVTAIIKSKLFEISEIPLPAAWPPFAAGLASSRICGAGPPSPSFEAGSPRQLRPVSGASNQRFSRAPKHCSSGGGSCSQKLSQPSSAEPDHRLQFAPVVTWEQDWDPPLDAKSLVGAETNRR